MFSTPQINQFDNSAPVVSRKKPILWIVIVAILSLILAVSIVLLIQSKQEIQSLKTSLDEARESQVLGAQNTDQEVVSLLNELGQLIVLPTDEQPTVATVTDLTQLAGQPFFEQAQIGDKVVIYNNSAKAILYRPSEKKVINIAPIVNDTQPPVEPVSPTQP